MKYIDTRGNVHEGEASAPSGRLAPYDEVKAMFQHINYKLSPLHSHIIRNFKGGKVVGKSSYAQKLASFGREVFNDVDTSSLPPEAATTIEVIQMAGNAVDLAAELGTALNTPAIKKVLGRAGASASKLLGNVAKYAGPVGYVALAASAVPVLVDIIQGKADPADLVFQLIPGGNEIARLFGYNSRKDI
jgi:hypothetical protein